MMLGNIKVTDRTLVYVLFIALAVLSTVTITGNRDARDAAHHAAIAAKEAEVAALDAAKAAKAAEITVSNQEHLNSHRIRTDAGHECLLVYLEDKVTVDKVTGFRACLNAKSKGTIDPIPEPETLE